MKDLIHSYEMSRRRILRRIHELEMQLRTESLLTHERELLTLRRDLLRNESIDMLHIIHELEQYL